MPVVGLRTQNFEILRKWENLDLVKDMAWLEPCDPALIEMLREQFNERKDLDPRLVSASELEKGTRQMWLEATRDFYLVPDEGLAAAMGTIKHNLINKDRPGFITEERLHWDYGSAKNDSYFAPLGWLSDLKNNKWYKVEKMLTDGVLIEGKGYAYQLNLFRVLMTMKKNQELLLDKYKWLKRSDLNTRRMTLACVPSDLNYETKRKAMKLMGDKNSVLIEVPVIPDKKVLAAFISAYDDKSKAIEANYAPFCSKEERWERAPSNFPVRCAKYCPVLKECQQVAQERGETHPLDAAKRRKQIKKVS